MNRFKSTILAFTKDALNYCIEKEYYQEDSIVFSKEFNNRVIYIDGDIKDKELLKFKVLKLSKPLYFDNGKEYVIVNQDNYKNIDFKKILTDKTSKYEPII